MQTVELLDKREQVMRLFTANGNSDSSEIHEYLFTLARKICEASHVSSDIKLKQLVGKFDGSKLPEEPVEINTYLDYLAENVAAHSTHTSSPRFIGHMTSALPFFVQPLSQFITALNQNTVKTETAKACTPLERQTLAFMHRLVYDLPDEFYRRHTQAADSTLGIMVSGGTIGNITALWCARNVSLSSRNGFPGVEAAGLTAALKDYGYEGAVVIGSSLMHYSLEKTADLLGIGTCGLVRVATDKHNRMDVDALRRTVAECRARRLLIIAIIGIAGTTDVGSIDPLAEIAKLAQEEGIHFHVDAAWGGPLLFSRRYKHLLSGIEQADSVTIDGHKQLYLPLGVGILVFRNPFLAQAIQKQARYIVRATSIDLGKRALEGSRPANALLLHAALHLVGPQGYEFLIDEGIRKTRYFAGGGTGNSPSATFVHLSPSSINITGISSTIGYLRPQSWQINHASLCNFSSPPVVRTQFGQRKISIEVVVDTRHARRCLRPGRDCPDIADTRRLVHHQHVPVAGQVPGDNGMLPIGDLPRLT